MEIRREDLDAAARTALVSDAQADALWTALAARAAGRSALAPRPHRARVAVVEALVLAVGLLAALPAAWMLLAIRDVVGGPGGAIGCAAASAALLAGVRVAIRRSRATAGVLLAAALALVPLAVHGLMHALGVPNDAPPADLGEWLAGQDFPIVAAAVVTTALALRAFRFPALAAVLAAEVWFAAMDAAPAIFGAAPSWNQHALLSALLGVLVLGAGFAVDHRARRDYAGWLYTAGLVSFWGGLSTAQAASRTSVLLYVLAQLWLLGLSLLVGRRRFAVLAAIGLAGVAGHAADALLVPEALPVALAAVCAAVAAGALLWVRHEAAASRALVGRLPRGLRRLLPPRAG